MSSNGRESYIKAADPRTSSRMRHRAGIAVRHHPSTSGAQVCLSIESRARSHSAVEPRDLSLEAVRTLVVSLLARREKPMTTFSALWTA